MRAARGIGSILMLEATEHENGDIGRYLEYSLEGLKPVAVGKKQVD